MDPSLQTLFMPLEQGAVEASGPALFLNAAWHPHLKSLTALDSWQPFRPLAAILEHQGIQIRTDETGGGPYALVIVAVPRQVEEAKYMLASAYESLAPGGWLLAGAANDANGARLEKWFAELGLAASGLSKKRARAVWARKDGQTAAIANSWLAAGSVRTVQFGDGVQFKTRPGLFSWDRADPGSALLAASLPDGLTGTGADFGCGIGYLSRHVLGASHALGEWHLAEADARALGLARENMEHVRGSVELHSHWGDLTRPVPGLPPLDVVVMNPPFHAGRKTDPAIGQAFIRTSAHHLKKGGRLFMVANAHLPYEGIVRELFSDFRALTQEKGFKIIEAVK